MVDFSNKQFKEDPELSQYIAGAFIGNIPMLVLSFALTFIDPDILSLWSVYFQILIYSTMLFGGIIAGYMVTRFHILNKIYRYIIIGLLTGLFCYTINFIYSMVLIQFLLTDTFNDYIELTFYLIGGFLGGLIRYALRKKRN